MIEAPKFKLEIDPQESLLSQLKKFEYQSSEYLKTSFSQGVNVRELVMKRSEHIDSLLITLWHHLNISEHFSLIAVGGYGRGELHPFSDIDLLILTDKKCDKHQVEKLRNYITFLWDTNLNVGHATRTLKQCLELAESDITVITNLTESRLLYGNKDLFEQMRSATAPSEMWDAQKFFDAKIDEKKIRYKKFNSSSYDLEPNVKSSPGGLRDIQLIRWLAERYFYPQSIFQLIKKKMITKKEYYALIKAQLFVWKIRFALHVISGTAEDRLLFDFQKDTAKLMGFKDSKNLLAVEKLMKSYYRSAAIIRNISDILVQAIEDDLSYQNTNKQVSYLSENFQVVNQRIDVINSKIFHTLPSSLLDVFYQIAKNPQIKGITSKTLRAIRSARNKINRKFAKESINKELFIKFWHLKHSSSQAIFLMKRSGVLSDYLPAFRKISGQMQYDMFHSYTVDEHTLLLLKNLTDFTHDIAKTDYPLCYEIMSKLEKPEIIYLAGLFHDIGKGRGGDHSEIGAQEALDFCQQHKMNEQDSDTISWLVANHLLMSLTAQKRDTSDPKVIKAFGDLVGTVERLELLYILTVADIRATNRSLWNSWKDSLLKELAISTSGYLKNEKIKQLETWQDTKNAALKILTAKGYKPMQIEHYWQHLDNSYFSKNSAKTISWHSQCILEQIKTVQSESSKEQTSQKVIAIRERLDGGGNEIFIYNKDVDDLFATLTATLAQHNLSVQAASIYTDSNGYCYDSFFTLNASGKATINKGEQMKLLSALEKNIAELDSSDISIQKRMPRQFKHFDVNTEIVFSNDHFSQYTRLDLVTKDQPGLLALLAQAFKRCNLRLHDARITTLGEKVEDTFIISHKDDTPINDIEDRKNIEQTIKKQLAVRN